MWLWTTCVCIKTDVFKDIFIYIHDYKVTYFDGDKVVGSWDPTRERQPPQFYLLFYTNECRTASSDVFRVKFADDTVIVEVLQMCGWVCLTWSFQPFFFFLNQCDARSLQLNTNGTNGKRNIPVPFLSESNVVNSGKYLGNQWQMAVGYEHGDPQEHYNNSCGRYSYCSVLVPAIFYYL